MGKFTTDSSVISISSLAKRVTLSRIILTELAYRVKKFRLVDLYCLFENQLWLEEHVIRNKKFAEEFGQDVSILSTLLKQINCKNLNGFTASIKFSGQVKEQLLHFLFPERNLDNVFRKYKGYYHLKNYESAGILNKFLPPKTFIGKGYNDKGSAKNLAFDGSPSWQEVSVHEGVIHKIMENKNEKDNNHTSGPVRRIKVDRKGNVID